MLQLFQTRDGPFFFIVTLVYTCHAFFAVTSKNIYPIYCFGHSSSQSVLQWNSFSPLKYIVYKCYSCFRPGMGLFFFIVTLVYTCRAFFAVSSKNIYPIHCFGHSSSQSVLQWNSFSPLKYIVYKCYSCFRPGMGLFFFIVTLVYTCRAFFAVSSKNIYPIHCFGHSSSQSVLQWNSFSPLKYIVYKCYSCFRPGMGHFFFVVTLVYTCRTFFAVSSKNIYPIYCFGHSSSQSVLQWNSFSPLKYIVYKCYSCFRPGMGHFFFIVTLVALFLLYHQKIFIPYIVLVTVRLSLFRNEILFLL